MREFAAGDIIRAKNAILLIVLLRLVMAGFWLSHSHEKWGWFQTNELQTRLARWSQGAAGLQQLYLERFAIPYADILQYLVVFGELAVGVAFLLGVFSRAAAWAGLFMALNFLFAQGALVSWGILGNPYGPVAMMAGIVAAYGGGEARWSLNSWLGGKHPILPYWDPER